MYFKTTVLSILLVATFFSLPATHAVSQIEMGNGQVTGIFRDTQVVQESRDYFFSQTGNIRDIFGIPTASGDGTSQYEWGLNRERNPVQFFLDRQPISEEELDELGISVFDSAVETLFFPSGNQLAFEGAEFSSQRQGETFVAGTLNFTNETSASFSSISISSDVDNVRLEISTASSNPVFQQFLGLTIGIESTTNVFDADGNILNEPSADFIFFEERPELGSSRVFEGESTSVEILMEFNSLDLIGFGAVADPSVGFVSSSVAVPEPSSGSFLILGVVAAACRRDKRWHV